MVHIDAMPAKASKMLLHRLRWPTACTDFPYLHCIMEAANIACMLQYIYIYIILSMLCMQNAASVPGLLQSAATSSFLARAAVVSAAIAEP